MDKQKALKIVLDLAQKSAHRKPQNLSLFEKQPQGDPPNEQDLAFHIVRTMIEDCNWVF